MRRPFFAILGGMGTLATESFIRLINQQTHAHCDQDFLDYVVFNDAGVPDRTAYIVDNTADDPFPVIADDIKNAQLIGASFLVLTCNTAHYFYDQFQALTTLPILHMPREAVQYATNFYKPNARIGFMGTEGSVKIGVYERAIRDAGFEFIQPDNSLQQRITALIYDNVKSGVFNKNAYDSTIQELLNPDGAYHCDAV
ncbi:MAG: amino acid racemase, partial [Bifidobacteriaceae bacterium]|nr:amino acid racemase [Bifidobacteriaceae bacterium]